jgi:hypothetical protein
MIDILRDLLLHHLPTFFSTVKAAPQKAPITPLKKEIFNYLRSINILIDF